MRSFITVTSLSVASASLLRVNINRTASEHLLGVGSETPKYGDGKCECIGIDNIEGVTETTAGPYPADLGARCEAWDEGRNEACKGANPEPWCHDKWCYVDPCKCDIAVIPKVSAYLPDGQYQGKSVYYSYATCGSKDQWTDEHHDKACVNQKTKDACGANSKCLWSDEHNKCAGKEIVGVCDKPIVDYKWGEKQCRCVGIDGQGGTTKMKIAADPDQFMDYPADTGATCDAWDQDRHPECKKADKPAWCISRWCFVDPCSCDLPETPPKGSFYLPGGKIQGKPVFYSYATCDTEDLYMDKEEQKSALKKQMEICSSAWAATPVVGLLLAFMNM